MFITPFSVEISAQKLMNYQNSDGDKKENVGSTQQSLEREITFLLSLTRNEKAKNKNKKLSEKEKEKSLVKSEIEQVRRH